MKDSQYKDINDSIDEIISNAARKGILHLYTEDNKLEGNYITINGKRLLNFGSCSYLGLEVDERLKAGVIDAVNKWGTQYSSSRTYVSVTPYTELEDLIGQIFEASVVITSSTSSGHISTIPTIILPNDAIILDQQVHHSVQTAAQLTKLKGTQIELIRHSRLDQLEEKIKQLRVKHQRIWYMIDGVYSMFGDFAPIHELYALLNQYEQFYLYVDDAHGMSWTGKNGRGYILSQVSLHSKMVLATSFAKAFGTGGAAFVFPEGELARRVKTLGGPLIYSGPMQPPMLGGTIASAKIHLSPEIYSLQNDLKEKIEWTNNLLIESGLPVMSSATAPIFFIGMGLPKVGNNIVKRLFNDGFYVNLSVFPAVPLKNTGIRFTITRHLTNSNIKDLIDAIKYNMDYVYKEENVSENSIRRMFNLPIYNEVNEEDKIEWKLEYHKSIKDINKKEWNKFLGDENMLNWEYVLFLESIFSNNSEEVNNWNFHFYIIRDNKGVPILMTFFTSFIAKEDIFSPNEVSVKIEAIRKENPNYLVSRIFMMGSLASLGNHLYIDKSNTKWKECLELLLKRVSEDQEKEKVSLLCLRDFDEADTEFRDIFWNIGFVKVFLPDIHILKTNFNSTDDYLKFLRHDKRFLIKKRALEFEECFDVVVQSSLSPSEANECYNLYKNVARRSYEVNVFDLPLKFFQNIGNNSEQLEIILLKLKPDYSKANSSLLVAMAVNYRSSTSYDFLFTGMDYDFIASYSIYYQILWQIIKRAINLKVDVVNLGLTASQNKRKFNAETFKQVAYVQAKDNFNMELIGLISAEKQ